MTVTQPDPFPSPPAFVRITAAAASDVGRVRTNNEDRVVVADLSSGIALGGGSSSLAAARSATVIEAASQAAPGAWFAAVCDGMGGEAGGEVASAMAVESLLATMLRAAPVLRVRARAPSVADVVEHAVQEASRAVFSEAQRSPHLQRMGTTATVVALARGEIVIGQVGDSRAYLLRGGRLVQLTRDQTLVAMIAAQTNRHPSEVAETVGSNIILQAVGAKPSVDVALTRVPIEDGDRWLICSDGLSGPVDDETMAAIVGGAESPAKACRELIDAANAAGGPDNVSCVVLHVAISCRD